MKKISILFSVVILVISLQNSIVELQTELTAEEKVYFIQKTIQSLGGYEYYKILQPKNLETLFLIMDASDKQVENLVFSFKTGSSNIVIGFDKKLDLFEDCISGMQKDFYLWINPIFVEKALSFLETKIDIINFCQAIKTDYYDQTLGY